VNQKVEFERMQAAFKRVAEKATRGTREERSGRFVLRDDMRFKVESEMQPAKVERKRSQEMTAIEPG
jgi:hypothetical protein